MKTGHTGQYEATAFANDSNAASVGKDLDGLFDGFPAWQQHVVPLMKEMRLELSDLNVFPIWKQD